MHDFIFPTPAVHYTEFKYTNKQYEDITDLD